MNWFYELGESNGWGVGLKIKAKLHEEQSDFQKITIYDTETFGKLMTLDDLVMVTSRDNFLYHEMITHPALFSHQQPKRVIIIGGGDCGTLREVLKHDTVQSAQQIEIDERVTRVSEIYFPELCEKNHDPRAQLLFIDGVKWMQDAAKESEDVIIIDSTDPIGPAEGLFNLAFYRECYRVLGQEGIFVQQSESPLLHMESVIRPMHEKLRQAGFIDTLTLHFPQPVYPSGWWSVTLASKDLPLNTFREEAAEQKTFATQYYNAAIHRAAGAAPEFFFKALFA